jgi:hypothetical protein
MKKLIGSIFVLAILVQAPAAFAQGSASGNILAQANVLTPVTVTPQQDLDFGNVIPGTNKSVAITGTTAGRWLVQGTAGAEVDIDFTALPGNLTSGVNNLPIVYGATDAGHNGPNNPATATTFNPATGTLANISNPAATLFVWIGGTVQPAAAQASGLYTGTVTLTATYTGN